MAWLSGWSYRKEISITGQSGAGTNYQVDFNIGDSAGGDFHLEGHCTNFPQDIEVTDNDGTTLLKFWIEDITADPLVMSVKVADDLGSNQTIYVYYGKSGATTNRDGDATFPMYAGFESDADGYSGSVGRSTDQAKSGSYSYKIVDTTIATVSTSNTLPFIIDHSAYIVTPIGQYNYLFDVYGSADDQTGRIYAGYPTAGKWGYINGGSWVDSGVSYDTNQWFDIRFVMKASSYDVFVDDVQIVTSSSYGSIAANSKFDHRATGSGSATAYFDDVRVRKYNSPEPAFSSAGSEETPPTGVSPTAVFYGPLVGPLGGPI